MVKSLEACPASIRTAFSFGQLFPYRTRWNTPVEFEAGLIALRSHRTVGYASVLRMSEVGVMFRRVTTFCEKEEAE